MGFASLGSPEQVHGSVSHPLERSAEMGLLIMGFASLGSPEQVHGSVSHPLVRELAARYGKSPAQVLLRWSLQNPPGAVVIPTATQHGHLMENLDLFDFHLGDEDLQMLTEL